MYGDGTFRSYFGAIVVPILDKGDGTISNVTHDWANASASLGAGLAITIIRIQIRNHRVDIAKERLAEIALRNHAQFVFFLDDDVLCPPDTLMKMIKLWKSDPKYKIISGVYWSKSEPSVPLIFKGSLEGSFWDWTTQDLIKADGAGAGCLFVDANVFKKMSKPWFSGNYYFEDPRAQYDIQRWSLTEQLAEELQKGSNANAEVISGLEDQIKKVSDNIVEVAGGAFDPNILKDKPFDGGATEDLYFYKKAKEELGIDLWVDCSIQCGHQDKATGRVFGISPGSPQATARYKGQLEKMTQGDKIVLDIGAGNADYYIPEGHPIKVDIDPLTKPDVVCDARTLPIEDCFADYVYSSHLLEHFSFKETMSVLREWIRVLKIGGTIKIMVPNLKWAAQNILSENKAIHPENVKRTLFMFYSEQDGDLKTSAEQIHKAGFTMSSLKGVFERLGYMGDIQACTTDGNFNEWEQLKRVDDLGYNIVVTAKKLKHDAPISLKADLKMQEEAKYYIGTPSLPDKRTPVEIASEEEAKVFAPSGVVLEPEVKEAESVKIEVEKKESGGKQK